MSIRNYNEKEKRDRPDVDDLIFETEIHEKSEK